MASFLLVFESDPNITREIFCTKVLVSSSHTAWSLPLLARIKTEFILGNLTRIVRDFIENNHCQKISKNPQNPHMYIPNFIAGINDFHKSVPQDNSNNF